LEKEDWESDSAKDIALAALAFALALALAALAFALAFALAALAFAAFALAAFAFAALAFAAFALAALAFADPKIFLVIGAYLHYRKRTRELQQAGSP
jgi:membrane protein implicated in regulation of membrane protease activity